MDITALGGQVLFSADAASFKDLLEDAVQRRIALPQADLRARDLRHANLDGALLPQACFDDADLTGANLSEAHLTGASFDRAVLYDTCFCESLMSRTSFCESRFARTDFSYATLSQSLFEGPDVTGAYLRDIHTMEGSLYLHDGVPIPFSVPPQTIQTRHCNILCFDQHILINQRLIDRKAQKIIVKSLHLMDRVLQNIKINT